MIRNGTADDFVERFSYHQRIAVDESNERVGTTLYVPNQFGIEYEFVMIESG